MGAKLKKNGGGSGPMYTYDMRGYYSERFRGDFKTEREKQNDEERRFTHRIYGYARLRGGELACLGGRWL